MADEEVALIDFWASPFAMRVRVALAEKGVEYESKVEDLSNITTKSSLLLEMNPVHKQIPVLIHNGRAVCESFIILQYIDEFWTHQPTLLPCDPYELAHARFLADVVDKKIFLTGREVWRAKGESHEEARRELIGGFKLLESELGDKTYFGGETFGVVDVMLIPTYSWFYALETYGNLSLVEECPKIVDWAKRCLEKESVAKSLPDQHRVYEFSLELKKKFEEAEG